MIQCLPTSTNISNNDMLTDSFSHSICITCLRGYAHSACTDVPVAFGGVGLKCVEHKCKNVFLLDTFESYLSEADSTLLKQRLQLQCLMDAGIEDIVTCATCDLKFSVPNDLKFFICHCGRIQCRSCPRAYDDEHIGKMCEEMDIHKLNIKISETVIRNCYKCGIAFIKEKGCNKMECRCGAKQCYICREKEINYNHFCSCFEPAEKHGKCPTCNKSCRIWENAEELDEIKINLLTAKNEPKNNSCIII